jgi:hypothetical protein
MKARANMNDLPDSADAQASIQLDVPEGEDRPVRGSLWLGTDPTLVAAIRELGEAARSGRGIHTVPQAAQTVQQALDRAKLTPEGAEYFRPADA